MQIATKSSLIFIDSSLHRLASCLTANNQAEFYQQISKGLIRGIFTKRSLEQAGNKLIALAEYADELRQMDAVEQTSQLLIHLPLGNKYKSIGSYYHALCVYRKGQFVEARSLFERAAEKAPQAYKARALLSIAATFYQSQDFHPFLSFCLEADRAATRYNYYDAQIIIKAQRNIALYKSLEGDHYGAVTNLERLFPIVRVISRWQPYLFYEHLNSFAVELGEVGRIEEAKNVCRIVLASPYAFAYPEWRETANEIAIRGYKSRSAVPVTQKIPGNLLYLPERERETYRRSPFHQPRGITKLTDWKKKMGKKKPNGDESLPPDASEKDLYLRLMELVAQKDLSISELRRVIAFVENISSEPDPKKD